jgi:hypothetical protein
MELFDKPVYNIVPDTQSILMTLVDNINSD